MRRRAAPVRPLAALVVATLGAAALGACGGPSSAAVPPVLSSRSGTGGAVVAFRSPPGATWRLAWTFTCPRSGGVKPFTLWLRAQGDAHGERVAAQQGVSGGGSQRFDRGTYRLTVTTACSWTVRSAPTA